MEEVQDFLSTRLSYPEHQVHGYYVLKLEITFSGNGKTYAAQGEMEVFVTDDWYMTDYLLESVDNVR